MTSFDDEKTDIVALDSKRILVVEDDDNIREVVTTALTDAGFEAEAAQDADSALRKVVKFNPNLIITDHDMPGMTGLDFLKELRQKKNYVAVIFMSGRGDNDLIVNALRSGADDYVRKPFRINELIARVDASLRTHELHRELMDANSKLQQLVDRDYLTGLFNMRSIYEKIDLELARARRYDRRISAIMLDMDHFKSVNDDHDHLFGSFVLKEVGRLITSTMREIDFAARYGGDEFLIVLTEVKNKEGTEIFCDRLRTKIEGHLFKDGKDEIKLTVSIGYAVTSGNSLDARKLVREADHNLYKAKEAGRNRFHGVEID